MKNTRIFSLLFATLCALCPFMALGQVPTLLKDINLTEQSQSILFGVQSGAKFFFTRTTPVAGWELWASDGTEGGTYLVKDIVAGESSSAPFNFVAVKRGGVDSVYFTAQTLTEGRELWVSDGTEAGTKMVKDINPGIASGNPEWFSLAPSGDTILFAATSPTTGREVWYSNGTEAGTDLFVDARPGNADSDPTNILFFGSAAIWNANDGVHGKEPWAFLFGTGMLLDINPGAAGSDPRDFHYDGTNIIFTATDAAHGQELWRTNFTTTTLVKDIVPGTTGSKPVGILNLTPGNSIFFTNSGNTFQLWKTDGTDGGTSVITTWTNQIPLPTFFSSLSSSGGFSGGGITGFIHPVGISNGKAYFFVTNPIQVLFDIAGIVGELWVSDGTSGGTHLIEEALAGPDGTFGINVYPFGSSVIAPVNDGVHGAELWISGGTPDSTDIIKDMNPGVAGFYEMSLFNSFTSFGGFVVGSSGLLTQGYIGTKQKLVFTDGTAANTRVIGETSVAGKTRSSSPIIGPFVGGKTIFFADDGVLGSELYATDGTPGGTGLLKDINPMGSSYGTSLTYFNSIGKALFIAQDGVSGRELWISDGTAAGTKLLKDINPGSSSSLPSLTSNGELNGEYFFPAYDDLHGPELWATNGTTEGTRLVVDINPGTAPGVTAAVYRLGNKLYFGAATPAHGTELWNTDGTTTGTQELIDINPGASSSNPGNFAVLGNELFFAAEDTTHGVELWKTNGTVGGTVLVKDISSGVSSSGISNTKVVGNKLFFSAADTTHGSELWVSDGTNIGTSLVKDIRVGAPGSLLSDFTEYKGKLLFSAHDGSAGEELWISDGTEAGTFMLKDIYAGASGSSPTNLLVFPEMDFVFFTASSSTTGTELWKTDGTSEGTVLYADIVPGADGSSVSQLLAANGNLFMSAETELFGGEPWVLSVDRCPGDLSKVDPGVCGCGAVDIDTGSTGTFDCLVEPTIVAKITALQNLLKGVRPTKTKKKAKKVRATAASAKEILKDLINFTSLNASKVSLTGSTPLGTLLKKVEKRTAKALKLRKNTLRKDVTASKRALTKLLKSL